MHVMCQMLKINIHMYTTFTIHAHVTDFVFFFFQPAYYTINYTLEFKWL